MDVADWLRALGLERYEATFRENDVDAELLPNLAADDLKELGITSLGHRRRLLEAIAALRLKDAPAGDPVQSSTSPTGNLVALLSDSNKLEVWSITDGNQLAQTKLETRPDALRFLNDTTIAVLFGRTLHIFTIKPPGLEASDKIELETDPADDNGSGGGGSGSGGAPGPDFGGGGSGGPGFGSNLYVDLSRRTVIEARGTQISSRSLKDGKKQAAFRDPVINAPRTPTRPTTVSRPVTVPRPEPPPPPRSSGHYGVSHYWRPN